MTDLQIAQGAEALHIRDIASKLDIPESQLEKNTDIATIGTMLGFAVMMTLDVALG